jgi:hypothetical protein
MANRAYTDDEIANMSDEEIMGMVAPLLADSGSDSGSEDTAQQQDQDDGAQDTEMGTDSGSEDAAEDSFNELAESDDADDAASDQEEEASESGSNSSAESGEQSGSDPHKGKVSDGKDNDAHAEAQNKTQNQNQGETQIDYKAAYERIMGPFKANGKEVKLQSLDEAIQLMQMGANYTKKLQALQPNLKLLKMLENNGLLDEGKLSYLIDIDKKNPQAIQKLVRESGIDPMEIDTTVEPTYKPSNHRVTDEEMLFTSTLEEVASDPVGKEMIVHINKTWDARSKEALWSDPAIMRVMTDHRHSGIYDKITAEIERRKVLGYLKNEPFLQTYYAVGQEMKEQGILVQNTQATETTNSSRVVDTRPAQKKTVDNNQKARAASPVKVAPHKTTQEFNPLALSDEDFEKNAALARRV